MPGPNGGSEQSPVTPSAKVEVKVAEIPTGRQSDIGRGIVRIESRTMRAIGVNPGDVIEIEGTRKSVAVVDNAYPSDIGLGIIRMDGLMRRNVGTSVGEGVMIKKGTTVEAKKVVIAPAQKGMTVQLPGKVVIGTLVGRAVVKGDVMQLKGLDARGRHWNSLFDETMDLFEPGMFGLAEMKFIVVNTTPAGAVRISDLTELEVLPETAEVSEERIPEVTYEDIGGLGEEVKRVREMLELPLKHPELFDRLGISPPKGVLLYGPPGTGKTLLAKAVANETNAHFIIINGPEVMSKYVGEAEKKIREVFEDAEQNAPCIIFIDEIDAVAPKREEAMGVEGRVVAQLLASLDGMKKRGQVMVIAATNRPNALDPALRRTGRFDREIELGVPTRKERNEILQIHTRNMPLAKDVSLDKLADVTHGYVGADLEGLCKEAAMSTLRRMLPDLKLEEEGKVPKDVLDKLEVRMNDFQEALKAIEPSAMREVLVEIPKVKWVDIGALDSVKQELQEAVEWPLKDKTAFTRLGIKPPKGIILYGPPGTGKTLLAKAVANESEANFISVKGPEVLSKWVGESEKAVREIFRRARQVSPCIIFFDEVDSIAPVRGTDSSGAKVGERIVNQLLTEMDGLEELRDVIVIAATNRPYLIDIGLLREGRFDRHIYVPVPEKDDRTKIFEIHTKGMPLGKDVDLEELVDKTPNYTGADIAGICREAAMFALRDDIKATEVKMEHFSKALEKVGPTVNDEIKKFYERIENNFKSAAFKQTKQDEMSYTR
jgi:transitional endoplasmic reticulum ATPase